MLPESPPGEALVAALRTLIREETEHPVPEASSGVLGGWQAFVLLVLALDLALVINLPPLRAVLGDRGIAVLETTVPFLLGGGIALYLEPVRAWLLRRSAQKRFGLLATSILFLLVIPQVMTYRVRLRLVPDDLEVSLDGKPNVVDRRATPPTLIVPSLGDHQLVARDSVNGEQLSETLTVGDGEILRGALPFALTHHALLVTVAYPVKVLWGRGAADLAIEGEFPTWFLTATRHTYHLLPSNRTELQLKTDAQRAAGIVSLPPGRYTFTLKRGSCVLYDSAKQVEPRKMTEVHLDAKPC